MRSLDRNIVDRKLVAELVQDTRGAEIAETAAVLPILFMILLGIFWFGQAFSIYGAITRAAQEGARAGSIAYCATCSGTNSLPQYDLNAAAAVQNAMQLSQLNWQLAQYPASIPPLVSCQYGTPVACDGSASTNFCIQTPIQLNTSSSGPTGLCGVSVTFQYPFQFWLPFTSINNQTIWIQATSRVRLETR
jgi:Flp pilus assembly protein TadG